MLLIVSNSKKSATLLADMFRFMGYLAKGTSPTEALAEINPTYRAIILLSPGKLYSAEDFTLQIRKLASSTPIFSIRDKSEDFTDSLFNACFDNNAYSAHISRVITDYTLDNELPCPGNYKFEGLDLSVNMTVPLFGFEGIPFTKTECMILRYLIRKYPTPTPPEEILDHIYNPSRAPDSSNIRTHISSINKKFRKITGRNLVFPITGEGYYLTVHERIPTTV